MKERTIGCKTLWIRPERKKCFFLPGVSSAFGAIYPPRHFDLDQATAALKKMKAMRKELSLLVAQTKRSNKRLGRGGKVLAPWGLIKFRPGLEWAIDVCGGDDKRLEQAIKDTEKAIAYIRKERRKKKR